MIQDLFTLFQERYERIFTTPALRCYHNPSKLSAVFQRTPNWIPLTYLMMMPAIMQDGTICAKSILVEDGKQRTRGMINLYTPDGGVTSVDAVELTRTRSALMAALAIYYKGIKDLTVGFVGNGPMNLEAWRIINQLFTVKALVLRGARQARAKNSAAFHRINPGLPMQVDFTPHGTIMQHVDVIISCTSNTNPAEALAYTDLKNVPLVIVQDGNAGGIHFTHTTDTVYVDHPEQSMLHWSDEFGDVRMPNLLDLTQLQAQKDHALVSLYGSAYFDGLLAQEQMGVGNL